MLLIFYAARRECAVWLWQEKNVSRDNLEGKVGRMYVPRQEVETMPLRKMKVSSALPKNKVHIFGAAGSWQRMPRFIVKATIVSGMSCVPRKS